MGASVFAELEPDQMMLDRCDLMVRRSQDWFGRYFVVYGQ